jgi:DNA-binding transcriptional MerR regulator
VRKYYSIREVSEVLEIKPHVLRYWETQFSQLRPRKHRGGARMYQERDLDLLRTIREMLYDRGYTIAGARQRLREEPRVAAQARPQLEMDFRSPQVHRALREVRNDLADLVRLLRERPGAPGRRLPRELRAALAETGAAEPASSTEDPGAGGGVDISVESGEAPPLV